MGVHKQSVSFTDQAFAFSRELVEVGEYPNISAAVSGELARARASREKERKLFEVEVQRRLSLPLDTWEPLAESADFARDARNHLLSILQADSGKSR